MPDTTGVLGSTYPQYKKMAEIKQPTPVEAMTFVDESIETLDDGYFAVNANSDHVSVWQNSPTARHGMSGGWSFGALALARAEPGTGFGSGSQTVRGG